MPDFVGTYEIAGDLPDKWNEAVRHLASSTGLEVRSLSRVGRRLSLTVRVPKEASDSAATIAGAFWADLVPLLAGPKGNRPVKLVSTAARQSLLEMSLRRFPLLGEWLVTVSILMGLLAVLKGMEGFAEFFLWVARPGISSGFFLLAALVGMIAVFFTGRRELAVLLKEQQQQAAQEQVWAKQVEGTEDPQHLARIELARIALRVRASSMRADADRLWMRSVWAYRGALLFFLLALAGPGVAALLVLDAATPDWHFMFGGLSLAAVPLGIGTALLRHDTRLREQYQESARDVAALERYELALDYARIASPVSYQATLQQVIAQLLSGRTASPPPPEAEREHGHEDVAGVQKLISVTVDAARDVVTSIGPKKGA